MGFRVGCGSSLPVTPDTPSFPSAAPRSFGGRYGGLRPRGCAFGYYQMPVALLTVSALPTLRRLGEHLRDTQQRVSVASNVICILGLH